MNKQDKIIELQGKILAKEREYEREEFYDDFFYTSGHASKLRAELYELREELERLQA